MRRVHEGRWQEPPKAHDLSGIFWDDLSRSRLKLVRILSRSQSGNKDEPVLSVCLRAARADSRCRRDELGASRGSCCVGSSVKFLFLGWWIVTGWVSD